MKIIGILSDHIEEEINDAGAYAKLACEYRESSPETAEIFYRLSLEEMTHMECLHNEVVRVITEYRKTKGEPPEGMKVLYDYLHRKQIETAAKVKIMQSMYKE